MKSDNKSRSVREIKKSINCSIAVKGDFSEEQEQ
jgi:hypothetical protein